MSILESENLENEENPQGSSAAPVYDRGYSFYEITGFVFFVKHWYAETKRKEATKNAENLVTPIVERLSACTTQSELDSAGMFKKGNV